MNSVKKKFLSYMPIIMIIIAGLAVRFAFYASIDETITVSDTPTYVDGAMNLYSHLWLNEYRPPVYPIGLMLMGILFTWENLDKSIILLQILLSVVNMIFVFKLAVETFKSKPLAYITAFVVAINFKVYCWDFIILTENFSILVVTLITYYLIRFLKSNDMKYLKVLGILSIVAIFLKPFFLVLPFALAVIILFNILIFKEAVLKTAAKKLGACLAAVVLCVLAYSTVNYIENHYFGITTVGNVNYFGKILQYKMEDLGSNKKLIGDIKTAFKTEKPEHIVDGQYLEPWHFIGTYGWNKNHYSDIRKFSKEIIIKYPVRYITESVKLTLNLMVLHSPFKDFIADSAVEKANHPSSFMLHVRKFTEIIDSLYIFLTLGFIETILWFAFKRKDGKGKEKYLSATVLFMILYHYAVSAFFSYGDYCRLLAPCYPLIYMIICLYVYRIFMVVLTFIKNAFSKAPLRSAG